MQNNQLSPNQALPRAEQTILRRVGSLPMRYHFHVIDGVNLNDYRGTVLACLTSAPNGQNGVVS